MLFYKPNSTKNLCFHCSFAKYAFIILPEETSHASVRTFFRCMEVLGELDVFALGVFSMRYFNLCILGNRNLAIDTEHDNVIFVSLVI